MEKENQKQKSLSVQERILEISHKLKISKDGKNSYSNYDYFKPETIMIAIVPLLIEYKLFMKFDLTWSKEQECYHGKLVINSTDNKTDYELFLFDIKEANVKGANPAMFSGATLTYCKRYSIMNAFNIADNNLDPDNEKTQTPEPKGKINNDNGSDRVKSGIERLIENCKTVQELTELYRTTPRETLKNKSVLNLFTARKEVLNNGK